ncbi:MAG: type II secretion system secretin GspD [Gammaproteobacteria bacterium]|nr:type II secretion system secretin GspD [Gammaproteobacteria bacterium]
MMSVFQRGLCALGLSFVMSFALAQGPERVTLSLDNADIRELINWAAGFTDKNIIVHPNVQGKVTVVAGDPMDREEAFNVFMSVLQVNGFNLIEQGDTLKVVPAQLAKQQAIPVTDGDSQAPAESLVVRTVRVQNIAATQLIAMLRPLIPQSGHLAAYADTNTLIIADRIANVEQIVRLIKQLDRAGAIDIELVPLEFASAKEIKTVLSELLQTSGKRQSNAQPLRIAVDERSNSVLLTGDPVTRQQLINVIQRLDQPLAGEGNTAVVNVQYANAEDLVPILEGMSGSIQKSEKDQQVADAEVSIQAHESLNALVLTAPPSMLETMRGVIAKLDVRRAQVLIEAIIVEVVEGTDNKLGINWAGAANNNVSVGFNDGTVDSGGIGNITDGDNDLEVPDVSDIPSLLLGPALLKDGLNLGFFKNGNLQGVLNAVASTSGNNVLSTPTIITLDNEEAEISVGREVSFQTSSQLREGTTTPFNSFEREDVATTLKVTPRVNNENSVTLEIEQTVEDITNPVGVGGQPETSKRELSTKVLVDDSAILVLGGLIEDKLVESNSKVPLLGDIPGIGRLFRSTNKEIRKVNLMVFIRPKILNSPVAAYEETRRRYRDLQQKQIELQGETSLIWDWDRGEVLPDLLPPAANPVEGIEQIELPTESEPVK